MDYNVTRGRINKNKDFDDRVQLTHYTKLKNTVINNLLSKSYLSTYSDNVLKMLNMNKIPPLRGSFEIKKTNVEIKTKTFTGLDPKYSHKIMNCNVKNIVLSPESLKKLDEDIFGETPHEIIELCQNVKNSNKCIDVSKPEWIKEFEVFDVVPNEIIELDFNKFYTSILQDADMFPLVNSFDEFIDYNGEPIDDLNVYYVEKTVENNEYPFYQFNLCMGKNIKGVENINIISVLDTSKNKRCNCKEFVKMVYQDKVITTTMKKDIFNHIVGNMNKSQNKRTYTDLKMDLKEALDVKKSYGGRIIPLERDDKMYYLNYMEKSTELQEGFRLISNLIYDTAHKRLLDLKKKVEDYGLYFSVTLTVYGLIRIWNYLRNSKMITLTYLHTLTRITMMPLEN